MRKFAWYGRLSTKDKQDPTISFPSQRNECAEKAKEPDARRFDAVIVHSTSRLSRELFHALAYERELARAGVEVFYARSAGDQTSPEERLIRHMFQALDQFEVELRGRAGGPRDPRHRRAQSRRGAARRRRWPARLVG